MAQKTIDFENDILRPIGSLEKDLDNLKSVMKDIRNNTPHVSTIESFYNIRRTGKVYQTKIWKFATNPTSSGDKLLDNAGLEFIPSTDTTEGKDDYLNGNHPLFDWVHCNYKRYDDGTAYPIATEYDDTYQETGSVDVGAMQMSFLRILRQIIQHSLWTTLKQSVRRLENNGIRKNDII